METVDQIKIIYRKLFTIKFVHDGYTGLNQDFISNAISIKPDAETKKLLADHHMLYRFFNDSLIYFIQCDIVPVPGEEPKRIPHINFTEEDVRIRFLVSASVDFLNRTMINATSAKQVYQFSNQANSAANMVICSNEDGVNNDDLKDNSEVEADESCLAVLDIHTGNVVDETYALLDAQHSLVANQPEYKIPFNSKI